MNIINNRGESVVFDLSKLQKSLKNSGAEANLAQDVIQKIQPKIKEGTTTNILYKLAFDELKNLSKSTAARYSLKRALVELGPAGFYFEQWISRVFQDLGYQTETGKIIRGHAVKHEADVIAKKDERTYWIECKFRNTDDTKISVTTPMYVLSRIKDISGISYNLFGTKTEFTDGWLITNAYFTADSIAFGNYYHLRMLSWDYPEKWSIKTLVDDNNLYPITCLTTITDKEKQTLLAQSCILVTDLLKNPQILESISMISEKKQEVIEEANALTHQKISE